jgi:hypothetical protein
MLKGRKRTEEEKLAGIAQGQFRAGIACLRSHILQRKQKTEEGL